MTVNHEERRQQIAEITAGVIAREGLEAATLRRISAEFGGHTRVVTYYFPDKYELLRFTWEHAAQQHLGSLRDDRSASLVDALLDMTACDERRAVRWRVYVAFWELAAREPESAERQRRHLSEVLRRIGDMIRVTDPAIEDVEHISLSLNALVQGISLQALVDPNRWPADRIRAALAEQVEMLLERERGRRVSSMSRRTGERYR